MSSLKEKVDALDAMIVAGDILGAVDRFFADEVVTQEGNAEDVIEGKAAKKAHLQQFFAGISAVNDITLHSNAAGDDVTMSEFTFDLSTSDGGRILWNEVLRRRWRNGLVVNERYYTAG